MRNLYTILNRSGGTDENLSGAGCKIDTLR